MRGSLIAMAAVLLTLLAVGLLVAIVVTGLNFNHGFTVVAIPVALLLVVAGVVGYDRNG